MKDHDNEFEKIKHLFKGIWTLENIDTDHENLKSLIEKAKENPH